MKRMISCLAILTIFASMVSCGSTENGATTENVVASKTTAADTSKANRITTTAANKKTESNGNSTSVDSSKLGKSIFGGYVTSDRKSKSVVYCLLLKIQ